MANQISKVYGVKDYLSIYNLDDNINTNIKEKLLKKINDEIEKDYNVHTAITHYIDKYRFVPPFVLVKILTFGVASSYYGVLKQSDRQAIAKYFKISDKLLKQILKNLTTIRNIAAHSDRLYNYTSKFYLSFKLIDKNYIKSDNITNLYMVVRCMEKLLTKEQYDKLYNSICEEIRKLTTKIKSIEIYRIIKIMGFPMNKKQEEEYNNEEVTVADENRINDSKIRYILLKDGEESSVNKSKILTDRTIDSGTIEKGQTISYSLRVWIDSKAETDIMGKIFNAQLNIEATQTSPQQAVAFKTGDYVKMTPTSTSYTITTAMTGYDTDQTINPSELNLWRVISINSDGTMDLVSEYVSSTNVYFQGKTGYQNFISSLNQIASQYTNSKYTTASRHMGYNGQTGTITDTSALDSTTAPWTSSTSSSTSMSDESKGGGDREYQKDFNLVKSVLGTAVANKVGTTEAAPYWLASRKYSYNSSTVWYFSGRGIGTGGVLGGSSLYVYRSGSLLTYRYSRAVRPIITLKSGLTPSGSGTSSSPYVLS